MIKCKLKCDKNYGGEDSWIDVDYIDTSIIKDIIDKFVKLNVLEVTEEVVDYYNETKTKNNFNNRKSYKTANAIITNIRKYLRKLEENKKVLNKEKIIFNKLLKKLNGTNYIIHSLDISEEKEKAYAVFQINNIYERWYYDNSKREWLKD